MGSAVIWDLDGTLLDSYDVIVESLYLAMQESGVPMGREHIRKYALGSSIKALFAAVAGEDETLLGLLKQRYSRISGGKYLQIKAMPNALQTLQRLTDMGVRNYVFTHRGQTTLPVLDNLGMTKYFLEILTSQSGFPRKPAPEAITYLLEHNDLDPAKTYYVGDRSLDMVCASNGGIAGILLRRPGALDVSDGSETYVVSDLLQVADIVIK